jgi:ribosomal protein L16 Arg81 hydroxylase
MLILETPFFLRESTLLLNLLFKIYDTFIDESKHNKQVPKLILSQLESMLRSLLINIESLQKDPVQLAKPAQHLYNIYNDPKYITLKKIFQSQEVLSNDSQISNEQTPKSQESCSINNLSKDVSIEQSPLKLNHNPSSDKMSNNIFTFSEIGKLQFDKTILSFKKLKSHVGFKYVLQSKIQSIETFDIQMGFGSNYFVEPGTISIKKIFISQEMIEQAHNNIMVLNYMVRKRLMLRFVA